jgi:1,4-alpha-glucan branching enzyme
MLWSGLAASIAVAAPSQPQNSEETSAQEPSKPGASSSEKRILFKYRDAQAQKVAISGEFSRWTPKPMKKDKNGNWTLVFRLKPGEYAYNFIVDGKLIRDPANRRMKPSGQKIPSSVLTVQP